MSKTVLESTHITDSSKEGGFKVVIFNNEHNSFEEVIGILVIATRCTIEEAEIEAWEAHTFGHANVFFHGKTRCEEVAQIIGTIGVKTEVVPEWQD